MAKESPSSTSTGISFFGLLCLLFIALKLTGTGPVATWSWWLVLSPVWGSAALALGILILVLLVKKIH